MGRKELNPADVYRKQQRKKDLKKCKENRNVVRSVQELLSDPAKIEAEIVKAQKASDESALDKGLKDRIKELKMMKSVAITKQKIDVASGKTDRDAASKIREAEMLQRDLNRDRRRGLLADDHSTRKNDEALDSFQKGEQGGASSSYQKSLGSDISRGIAEGIPIVQQQVYHQLPAPMGIAPSILPSNLLPVQDTSFRHAPPPPPPPPRPPAFNAAHSTFNPPLAYPDTPSSEQTTSFISLAAIPLPPAPPPPRPFLPNLAARPVENVTEGEDQYPVSNVMPSESEGPSLVGDEVEVVHPTQIELPPASAAFSFPFSLADFKLPTAEELMKRRHALVNDIEATTVEFDRDRDDPSASFPSYPQPHTLMEEQEVPVVSQRLISSTEESVEREDVFKINPIRVHSIYIPPAVPVRTISGLGGLAGYGSDSDQDNDEETDSPAAQKQQSIESAPDVPRFVPQKFTMLSNYDASNIAHTMAAHFLPNPSTSSTVTNHSHLQPGAVGVTKPIVTSATDDVNAFLDSIASSEIDLATSSRIGNQPNIAFVEKKPPVKPALKSVKLDAALTAFLPSALRIKRPAASQAGRPFPKIAIVSAPSAVLGASDNKKEVVMAGGVEDAYLNFLDEIGELTG